MFTNNQLCQYDIFLIHPQIRIDFLFNNFYLIVHILVMDFIEFQLREKVNNPLYFIFQEIQNHI